MKISHYSKQEKAYQRVSLKLEKKLEAEGKHYSHRMGAVRGCAVGWIAGVRWARRNKK